MNRIRLSREDGALCAQSGDCFPVDGKWVMRQKWVDDHDLFFDNNGRVFALVDTKKRVFFMDVMTGSLYQFGECLTSDVLKAKGLARNQKEAGLFLMTKPSLGNNKDDAE